MTDVDRPSRSRIPSLDGLRAVSISFVLADHAMVAAGGAWLYLIQMGPLGVRVFLVISGFLITTLLLAEEEKYGSISLSRFYFRRTLRIFPPAYALFGGILLLGFAGLLVVRRHDVWLAAAYLTDLFRPSPGSSVGHTYSLSLEEQFYLLWPGLLVLAGPRRATTALLLVILLAPILLLPGYGIHSPPPKIVTDVLRNAPAVAIGCLLALFRSRLHGISAYRRLLASPLWLAAAVVILAHPFLCQHPRVLLTVGLPLTDVCIAFILDHAMTLPREILGRLLNLRPVAFLGLLSYSIYLWQQPLLMGHGAPQTWPVLLRVGAVFPIAWISYRFVEQPSLRMRERLESRWLRRRTLSTAFAAAERELVV